MEWSGHEITSNDYIARSHHAAIQLQPPKLVHTAMSSSSSLNLKKKMDDFLIFGGGSKDQTMNEMLKVLQAPDGNFTTEHVKFKTNVSPPACEAASFVVTYPHASNKHSKGSGGIDSFFLTEDDFESDQEDDNNDSDDDDDDEADEQPKSATSAKSRLAEALGGYDSSDDEDKKVNDELIHYCKVVLFGGFNGKEYLDDLWILTVRIPAYLSKKQHPISLDDLHFEWKQAKPNSKEKPSRRSQHTACLYEKRDQQFMVVYGGFNGTNSLDDIWMLDLQTLMWKEVKKNGTWPCSRHGHTANIVDLSKLTGKTSNKQMVVFFGQKTIHTSIITGIKFLFDNLKDCWMFDLKEQKWTEVNLHCASVIKEHLHHTCCYIGKGCFFIFGGANLMDYIKDIYVVDILRKKCVHLPKISSSSTPWPSSRKAHISFFNPLTRNIIVHGGYSRNRGYMKDVWIINADNIFTVCGLGTEIDETRSPRQKASISTVLKNKKPGSTKKKYQLLEDVEKLSKSIAQNPKNIGALTSRYETYMQLNMYDKALEDISTCLALDMSKEKHFMNEGICHFKLKKYEKALKPLGDVISSTEFKLNQQSQRCIHIVARKIRGKSNLKLNWHKEALEDVQKTLDILSVEKDISSRKSKDIIKDSTELVGCVSCFKTKLDSFCFMHQYNDAYSCCKLFKQFIDKEIELQDKSSGTFGIFKLKKSQVTNTDYLKVQKLKLKSVEDAISLAESKHNETTKIMKNAKECQDKKNYGEAIKYYLKAIEMEGKNEYAILELANCYLANKEFSKATKIGKKLLSINSQRIEAYFIIGDAYIQSRNISKGINVYENGLNVCTNAKQRNKLIDAQRELRQRIQSAENKKKILEEALEHGKKGINFRLQRLYDNAIEEFSKAIEKDEEYIHFYIDRAKTYMEIKNFNKAMEDAQAAMNINPNSTLPYVTLVTFLMETHHYNKARDVAQKGLQMSKIDDMEISRLHDQIVEKLKNEKKANYYRSIAEERMNQMKKYFLPVESLAVQTMQVKEIPKKKKEEIEQILMNIEKALDLYKKNMSSFLLRARIYYILGQFAKCVEDVRKVLQIFESDEEIEKATIKQYAKENLLDSDRKFKTDLIYQACCIGAKAYASMSNYESSFDIINSFPVSSIQFDSGLGAQYHSKLQNLKKELEKGRTNQQNLEKFVSQARSEACQEKYAKAAENYKKALNCIDTSVCSENNYIAVVLFEYAECLFLLGQYEKCLETIEQGLFQDKSLPFYYSLQALAFVCLSQSRKSKDYEKALAICVHALNEYAPCNTPINYIFLKLMLFITEEQSIEYLNQSKEHMQKNPKHALELVSKCIQYYPSNISALYTRASLNLTLGQLQSAITDASAIIRLIRHIAKQEIEEVIIHNRQSSMRESNNKIQENQIVKQNAEPVYPVTPRSQQQTQSQQPQPPKKSGFLSSIASIFKTPKSENQAQQIQSPIEKFKTIPFKKNKPSAKQKLPERKVSDLIQFMVDAMHIQASGYLRMRKLDTSKQIILRALEIIPNHQQMQALYSQLRSLDQGMSDARNIYEQVKELKVLSGREEQCIKLLSDAIKMDSENVDYYVERAGFYLSISLVEHALNDTNKALQLNNNDKNAIVIKIKALCTLYRFDEARGEVEGAKNMISAFEGEDANNFELKIEEMEEELHEVEKKSRLAEKILQEADALSNDGDYESAARKYFEASKIVPGNAKCLHRFIECLVKTNPNSEKLSPACSLYIKLHPKLSKAYTLTTDIYSNVKHDHKEALFLATCGIERNCKDRQILNQIYDLIKLDALELDKCIMNPPTLRRPTFAAKDDNSFVKTFILSSKGDVIDLADLLEDDDLALLDDIGKDLANQQDDADEKEEISSSSAIDDGKSKVPIADSVEKAKTYQIDEKKHAQIYQFVQASVMIGRIALSDRQLELLKKLFGKSIDTTSRSTDAEIKAKRIYAERLVSIHSDKHHFYQRSSFKIAENYEQWKKDELQKLESFAKQVGLNQKNLANIENPALQKYEQQIIELLEFLILEHTLVTDDMLSSVYSIASIYGVGKVRTDLLLLQCIEKTYKNEELIPRLHLLCKIVSMLVRHIINRSDRNPALDADDIEKTLFFSPPEAEIYKKVKDSVKPVVEIIMCNHYRALITNQDEELREALKLVESCIKTIHYFHIISVFLHLNKEKEITIRDKIIRYIEMNHQTVGQLFIAEAFSKSEVLDCSYLNVLSDGITKYIHSYVEVFDIGDVFPKSIDEQILQFTTKSVQNLFYNEIINNIERADSVILSLKQNKNLSLNQAAFNVPKSISKMTDQLAQYGSIMFEKSNIEQVILPYLFLFIEQQEDKLKEWANNAVKLDSWKVSSPNILYTSSIVDVISALDQSFKFVLRQASLLMVDSDLAFAIEEGESVKIQRSKNLQLIYISFGDGAKGALYHYATLQKEHFSKYFTQYLQKENIIETPQDKKGKKPISSKQTKKLVEPSNDNQLEELTSDELLILSCRALSNVNAIVEKINEFIVDHLEIKDNSEKNYIDYKAKMQLKERLNHCVHSIERNIINYMIGFIVENLISRHMNECFLRILEDDAVEAVRADELMNVFFKITDKHLDKLYPYIYNRSAYIPLLKHIFDNVIMLFKERLIPPHEHHDATKAPIGIKKYKLFKKTVVTRLVMFFAEEHDHPVEKDKDVYHLGRRYVREEIHELLRIFSFSMRSTIELLESYLRLTGNLAKNVKGGKSANASAEDEDLYRDMDEAERDELDHIFDILIDFHVDQNVLVNYILGILHYRGFGLEDGAARDAFEAEMSILESTSKRYQTYFDLKQKVISNAQSVYNNMSTELKDLEYECSSLQKDYRFLKTVKKTNKERVIIRKENQHITNKIQDVELQIGNIDKSIEFCEQSFTKQLSFLESQLISNISGECTHQSIEHALNYLISTSLTYKGAKLEAFEKCMHHVTPGYLCLVNLLHFDGLKQVGHVIFLAHDIQKLLDTSVVASHLYLSHKNQSLKSLMFDVDTVFKIRPFIYGNHMDNIVQLRIIKEKLTNPKYYLFHSFSNQTVRNEFLQKMDDFVKKKKTKEHENILLSRAALMLCRALRQHAEKHKFLHLKMKTASPEELKQSFVNTVAGYPISSLLSRKFRTAQFQFDEKDRLLKKMPLIDAESQLPGTLYIFTSAVCYDTNTSMDARRLVCPFSLLHKISKVEKNSKQKMNLTLTITHRNGRNHPLYANTTEERDNVFDAILSAVKKFSLGNLIVSDPIVVENDSQKQTIIVFEIPRNEKEKQKKLQMNNIISASTALVSKLGKFNPF